MRYRTLELIRHGKKHVAYKTRKTGKRATKPRRKTDIQRNGLLHFAMPFFMRGQVCSNGNVEWFGYAGSTRAPFCSEKASVFSQETDDECPRDVGPEFREDDGRAGVEC